MMEWPSDNELVGDAIRYLGRHIAVSAHGFAESIIKEQAARRSAGHPYHPYPEKPFVQVEAPDGSCVCEKCAPVYFDGPNRAEAIRRGRERLAALAKEMGAHRARGETETQMAGALLAGKVTLFGKRVELVWPDGLPDGFTEGRDPARMRSQPNPDHRFYRPRPPR